MMPLLQEDAKKISTLLEAVKELFVLMKDVALFVAKDISKRKPDLTKQRSKQMDAAKQDKMQLVDVV